MKKPYVPPEIEIRRVVVRECISTSDTEVGDSNIPGVDSQAMFANEPTELPTS